jgi:hypothetical protein
MKLVILKQAWNNDAPQEVAETWELADDGKAQVTFSKSPTGSFYSEVKDKKTKAILQPSDGIAFLQALYDRLKKAPFTDAFIAQ